MCIRDRVKVVRDECGLATGFETEGDFPKYGNDDDRADEIGVWLLRTFLEMIKKRHTYRNSEATTSILTITSNVVYGKYTGALPDGRAAFTPFAPGAVSYTHLDVYKRQILGILCVVHLGHALLFFIIPAQSHTCLLYTSRCV